MLMQDHEPAAGSIAGDEHRRAMPWRKAHNAHRCLLAERGIRRCMAEPSGSGRTAAWLVILEAKHPSELKGRDHDALPEPDRLHLPSLDHLVCCVSREPNELGELGYAAGWF